MVRALRWAVPLLCAAGVAAGVAVSGCSVHVDVGHPQLSTATLDQGISDTLTKKVGQRPDSVTCPNPLDAQVGKTERCSLTAGGTKYGLTVTITSYTNGTANYDVQVDNQPEN